MTGEYCLGALCFVPLAVDGPRFFGFSEFLASLALMVLAWTIADIRYRFRVKVAPLPLQRITFAVVSAVGVLALLTDLWRAEQWLVPQGNLLTPAIWQAILGGAFLLTFLAWAWFAFISPPVYGKRNAERFARALYRVILKGSPEELSVIADELALSVRPLVGNATDRGASKNFLGGKQDDVHKEAPPKVEAIANDLLLLIADKRFCRSIVGSASGTALALFQEIGETTKYGIQVETFAKNIVNEALANKDSFLFHEAEGYESGLLGYHKPISQAIFGNYRMVETIGTLLDPDITVKWKWDADQWEAYCRMILMVLRDYVEKDFWNHSVVLYRAKGNIEHAVFDLYKINGIAQITWNDDIQARLRVIVSFIKDAVEILDKRGVPKHLKLRVRDKHGTGNFYDHLASMIFEIIFSAAAVRSPIDLCWWIQHNSVWGELFNFNRLNGPAGKIIKHKVRRLIYDEIKDMRRFPNFKGAKILGYCLNVMGLSIKDGDYDRDSRALQKAVLIWTKKNYAWLHSYNPRVAEACLVDGMSFDEANLRLVKTYPADGLRREPKYVYCNIDPPPLGEEGTAAGGEPPQT